MGGVTPAPANEVDTFNRVAEDAAGDCDAAVQANGVSRTTLIGIMFIC
jgi:hypothetical protein